VRARLKTRQPFAGLEIPLLRLSFRRMPNSEHPYSPITPVGDFLQGRVTMVACPGVWVRGEWLAGKEKSR